MTEGAGIRVDYVPDGLTATEAGMWQAFRNGSDYDLRDGDPAVDDPHGEGTWGPERSVRARIVAWLLLDGPPALAGRVSSLKLTGILITDTLDLAGGTVVPYVELNGCRFEKEVLLPEARFTTVRFVDCSVPRLEAARVHTEGDLHLARCRFQGGVRLTDAHIGTDLMLNQAVVHRDRRGRSISADGLTVGQDLQADMLESHGELSMRGAKVGVSLSLRGARLTNPYTRLALNAPQLTVERTLYLTPAGVGNPLQSSGITPARGTRVQRFECRGGIRLDDGRFGDAVDLDRAHFVLDDDQELSLRRVQTPELRFLGDRPGRGKVILSGARIVNLVDRWTSWPGLGDLHMGGFAYENLVPQDAFPLARRLEWVAAATAEYNPEPYERLAAVLRNSGEDEDAREVLLAKQRRRRETLPLAAKLWGYVQDWTVAYGYRPGRAAVWMAVLWAAASIAFSHASHPPVNKDGHPAWNPSLFALDLLLPVIDLGQAGQWRLNGAWQWLSTAVILLGWILATTVAAGATRLLRRS
ncbi:pentapeptide repeat-containing protein [Streptomyces sp. NPDC003758]|uniref:Pentapeptide repeat-containing protein n=1 Tax=Streptomyces cynarae TaxID=2981134 RepID=A0ABY6E0E2_9ACTN|nr:pentapeptide repeat-containing protein [Streptomyces cynarae]UXY19271.1 pentapeptide repeat-containing protein [Streptomyces cynarae]